MEFGPILRDLAMDAKLIVVGGEHQNKEISLKLPAVVGRGRGVTLTLPHPLVSRKHCMIFESDGLLAVRDMGSLNGTFINNERITEAVLPSGQLLTIGTVTFRAVYEAGTAGTAAPKAPNASKQSSGGRASAKAVAAASPKVEPRAATKASTPKAPPTAPVAAASAEADEDVDFMEVEDVEDAVQDAVQDTDTRTIDQPSLGKRPAATASPAAASKPAATPAAQPQARKPWDDDDADADADDDLTEFLKDL